MIYSIAAALLITGLMTGQPISAGIIAGPHPSDHCDCPSIGHEPRRHDDIWLISSRQISCEDNLKDTEPRLIYWRYDHQQKAWKAADLKAFLASDRPQIPTRLWIHGNRIDFDQSDHVGWMAYRVLLQPDEPPVRFVIWSWASDRVRGQLRDVRLKAELADHEAYYVAWLLNRIDPGVRLQMTGYSYGPRIITAALHLLGGGDLDGMTLPRRNTAPRKPIRAVLMAAALNDDWLLPDGYHGRAISQTECILSFRNHCDPVLRWYRYVARCKRVQALGYSGLVAPEALGTDREKYVEIDVRCTIGRHHDWRYYLQSKPLMRYARKYLSGNPPEAKSQRPLAAAQGN